MKVGDYVCRIGARAMWGVGVVVGRVSGDENAWRVARRLGWSGRGLDKEAGGRGDVGWLVLSCSECGKGCVGVGVGVDGKCAGMCGERDGVKLHFPRWQDLRLIAGGAEASKWKAEAAEAEKGRGKFSCGC